MANEQVVKSVDILWDGLLNNLKTWQQFQTEVGEKTLQVFNYQKDFVESTVTTINTMDEESKKAKKEMLEKVQEIEEKGGHAIALKANVSEEEDSQHLIEKVLKQFSKVDILINNAGITKDRSFRKMSKDEWDQVINVNLNGIFHTTSAVINHMIERKYGRIINISSIIGQAGGFGQTNYAASKAGILGFTKSLALETAKNGITVNAVCPGFIETEMVAAMPENVKEKIVAKVPMQRLGTTCEIAEAVLYLIQASFVTGQEINVNGGLYM